MGVKKKTGFVTASRELAGHIVKTVHKTMTKRKEDHDGMGLLSDDGVVLAEVTEWIPSLVPQLDYILGGGWPVRRAVEVFGPEGKGKCLSTDTQIRMFDGSKRAAVDVKIGDRLMGDDSTPRLVQEIDVGRDVLYRVSLRGGDSFVCTGNHRLCFRLYLRHRQRRRGRRSSCGGHFVHREMSVVDFLKQSATFRQHAMAYRVPLDYPAEAVPVPPHFLGLWLGDGLSSSPRVCTADTEVVEELVDTACRFGLTVKIHYGHDRAAPVYALTAGKGEGNPLLMAMQSLGVMRNKHIPRSYLVNARQVRLELLAGLIDSDGSCNGNGYEITQKRKGLSEDIQELARSLGLYASLTQKDVEGTMYWRVCIHGRTLGDLPVLVRRKQLNTVGQRVDSLHSAMEIENIGCGGYIGLTVDGNQRFVLGNFVVTHNSALTHMAIKGVQAIGGTAMLLDFEAALDPDKMVQMHIDPKRLIYIQPDYIEQAWDIVWATLDRLEVEPPEAPFLIVWDSVAASVPKAELDEKSSDKAHIGLIARSMSKGCRKMYKRVAKVRACMMWVNQIREKIGGFGFGPQTTTPGGRAVKFASSVRLALKYAKTLKVGARVTGYQVFVKTAKTRLSPPHRGTSWVLDFEYGPSPELSVFHYLLDERAIKSAGGGLYKGPWSETKFGKRDDFVEAMQDKEFRKGALVCVREKLDAEHLKKPGTEDEDDD